LLGTGHDGANENRKEQAMSRNISSARTITAVPAVRYRNAVRDTGAEASRELLVAGALFAALVVVGTAFFFAVAPTIANLGALYAATT
jgi:hypothetical protein